MGERYDSHSRGNIKKDLLYTDQGRLKSKFSNELDEGLGGWVDAGNVKRLPEKPVS